MNPSQLPDTIPALPRLRARATPDAVACRHRTPDGRWLPTTWRELAGEVERVAAGFRALGLGKGDRLAVLAPTCREWQVAELAGLTVGAVVVGIEAHAPAGQVQAVLTHSEACALVVDGRESWQKAAGASSGFKFVV